MRIELSEEQTRLVMEGLQELLKVKKEALETLNKSDMPIVKHRPFEARDFGIPQIEALLKHIDAEDTRESYERGCEDEPGSDGDERVRSATYHEDGTWDDTDDHD